MHTLQRIVIVLLVEWIAIALLDFLGCSENLIFLHHCSADHLWRTYSETASYLTLFLFSTTPKCIQERI